MHLLIDVFRNSILITGLVMVMMLLIEYIHIHSQGRSFARLKKQPFRQICLAALLGLIPGCIGGFAAVSLFSHGLISFGALIAMMISTVGDEAFVLFAMIPKTALLITAILFPLAILCGWLIDKFLKKRPAPFSEAHLALHEEDGCHHGEHTAIWGNWKHNLRHMSLKRGLLLLGLLAFILSLGLGFLEHDHEHGAAQPAESALIHEHGHPHELHDGHQHGQASQHGHTPEHELVPHEHKHTATEAAATHEHAQGFNIFSERWLNILFTFLSLFTLILTLMAGEHFVKEHLWDHIIKKHLPSIFCWTLGALLFIALGLQYLHLDQWITQNSYLVLIMAAFIGLIPESGPHMVFISLFASGNIPFSILLTSSLVQDGHTSLPLLAESKKAFFKAKLINLVIGLVVGSALYFCGC